MYINDNYIVININSLSTLKITTGGSATLCQRRRGEPLATERGRPGNRFNCQKLQTSVPDKRGVSEFLTNMNSEKVLNLPMTCKMIEQLQATAKLLKTFLSDGASAASTRQTSVVGSLQIQTAKTL